MKQKYLECDEEELFSKLKIIIGNGGFIHQVVTVSGRCLIVYSNK